MVLVLIPQALEVVQVLLSLKVCDWVFTHVVGQSLEKLLYKLYLRNSSVVKLILRVDM